MHTELRVFLLGDWVSMLNRSMARSPGGRGVEFRMVALKNS